MILRGKVKLLLTMNPHPVQIPCAAMIPQSEDDVKRLIKRSRDNMEAKIMKMSSPLSDWAKLLHEDPVSESESDYCESPSEDEEESRIAQTLVKAAFSRTQSNPSLEQLLSNAMSSQPSKKARLASHAKVPCSPKTHRMQLSASAPMLLKFPKEAEKAIPSMQNATFSTKNGTFGSMNETPRATVKPDDYLRSLLKPQQFKLFPAASLNGFFQELTKESVEAYDMELVQAVRDENVELLRAMLKSGRTMHAGNKFGETIIHAACRRGSASVLRFLLHEAGAPLCVCCDYERTPLHDACWTSNPNWKVISKILDECPDLLYITDKRGFTPLAYVPKEYWGAWCRFLERRGAERLQPKRIHYN